MGDIYEMSDETNVIVCVQVLMHISRVLSMLYGVGSSHSDKEIETPEKPVTKVPGPERKRKRKADDGGGGGPNSGANCGAASGSSKSTKKINDYFSSKVTGGSPNRHQLGGAKSPSPHPSVKPMVSYQKKIVIKL